MNRLSCKFVRSFAIGGNARAGGGDCARVQCVLASNHLAPEGSLGRRFFFWKALKLLCASTEFLLYPIGISMIALRIFALAHWKRLLMNTELLVIWTIINACWSIGVLVTTLGLWQTSCYRRKWASLRIGKEFITSATQRLEFLEVSMTVDKFVFSGSLSLCPRPAKSGMWKPTDW